MKAIFKKELQTYFKTPIAYIFIGVFLIFSAFVFYMVTLAGGNPSMNQVLNNLMFSFMVIIPILTMRLFSEEKNKKTDQLLMTSPVSVMEIVLGKFLAACVVFVITLLLTLIYLAVIAKHAEPSYPQIFCHYLGFFLLGVSYISIGLFISSLTEN